MNTDIVYEILKDIKRKSTVSILTGIGVAWGIFILILLIGVGNGFQQGVMALFAQYLKKTTYVYCGETSKIYHGTTIGKKVFFDDDDIKMIKRNISFVRYISPEIDVIKRVYVGSSVGQYTVKGVSSEYFQIRKIKLNNGRLLNFNDVDECRKVVIIGKNVADIMFKHRQPVGSDIKIGDEVYTVVGIIGNSIMGQFEEQMIYMPYSTFCTSNADSDHLSVLLYSATDNASIEKINARIKNLMAIKHHIAPDDETAFYFNNMEEQTNAFNSLFSGIRKFLWIMGLSTLVGGIIGVGNIMYCTVKERTKEIGIRKSIGASCIDIKKMFLYESIVLTFSSGCVGIVIGNVALTILSCIMDSNSVLTIKPYIDIQTSIAAMFVLIVAGTLAGLRPAVYAASLRPIEAIKEDF